MTSPTRTEPQRAQADRGPQAHRSRRGTKGGRPDFPDRELHWGRKRLEGPFALLKQWRRPATRYDEHL